MTPWRFTLLGYQLGLAKPAFLVCLGIAAVIGLLALLASLGRQAAVNRTIGARLAGTIAPGVSVLRPSLQVGFYTVGLLLFAFALAQPQCGSRAELTKRRGIDVVVALDASKSMLARDIAPSRLDRAKLELASLLDELKGDRVAIVAFAGDAFIQCPLTGDYAAAKLFLKAIDPDSMPQGGTNIGAALKLSKDVLDGADRGAKDKVVVLLSDGEDFGGEIKEGLDGLKEAGVRIYAVGIGSELGEPIPLLNTAGEIVGQRKDEHGNTVLTKLDKAGLMRLAEATEGEFFYQPKSVAMSEVVQRIDQLQKSELESRLTVRYAEVFQYYLAPGIFFLALGMLVLPSLRWRRT